MKTTIYFHQNPSHRQRQRDTFDQCPPQFLKSSSVNPGNFIPDHHLHAWRAAPLRNRVLAFAGSPLWPINLKWLPRAARSAQFSYLWGGIPLWSPNRHLIELDNPYVLTFYRQGNYRCFAPILKNLLARSSCHRLVAISQATRALIARDFGRRIHEKCQVVYPYMEDPALSPRPPSSCPRLLFVSTKFKLKGGPELVRGCQNLLHARKNFTFRLVVVTPNDQFRHHFPIIPDFVELHHPMDREKLRREFFASADALLLPSLYDSFGMVLLEALSFGLAILATNTYAFGEMVEDRANGCLIENPLFPADPKLGFGNCNTQLQEEVEGHPLPEKIQESFTAAIQSGVEWLLENLPSAKLRSRNLFLERFSPERRARDFANLFE